MHADLVNFYLVWRALVLVGRPECQARLPGSYNWRHTVGQQAGAPQYLPHYNIPHSYRPTYQHHCLPECLNSQVSPTK